MIGNTCKKQLSPGQEVLRVNMKSIQVADASQVLPHLAGGDMEVAGELVEREGAVHPAGVLGLVGLEPPGGGGVRLGEERDSPGRHVGVELGEAGLPEDVLQLVVLLPQVLVQSLHLGRLGGVNSETKY